MIGLLCFVLAVLASPFKSKSRLEVENAVLRHQLIVLRRKLHGRVRLTIHDRWFFIQLYRWFPPILKVLTVARPETLVRWHRAGFRCYWRWKSRPRGGRAQIETELRVLIRRMSAKIRFGARLVSMVNCSSSGLRSLNWDDAPKYLIRDRDQIYGAVVTRRLRAMKFTPLVTSSLRPDLGFRYPQELHRATRPPLVP
jgi:hypothetical protein